jgi:hypothetical protein
LAGQKAEDGEECPGEGRVKAGPATNAHLNQPTCED